VTGEKLKDIFKVLAGFSDHDAVVWASGRRVTPETKRTERRRNLAGMCVEQFQMTLATQAWETLCMVDKHEAAVQFSKMIKAALDEHAQEREVEVRQRRSGKPSEQLVNL
jgi:hypothetical protein